MTAKRRLSNFDFSKKGCHVSLVSPDVGGAANGRNKPLVMKALGLQTDVDKENNQMEMVEKSAVEALVQKAVKDAVELVQKSLDEANAQIAAFKAEKQEMIYKSRKDALVEVMGAENAELEKEFAILKDLPQEAFDIVVKSKGQADKTNPAFRAVGVEGEAAREDGASAEMKILTQKFKKEGK